MITAAAFAGKHYAVLGLARSGLATVEALLASGARVTAWDDDEGARDALVSSPAFAGEGDHPQDGGGGPPSALRAATSPAKAGEESLNLAPLDDVDLSQFDSIVVTPGLPLNRHPIARRAAEAGVEIIGDIELFARARAELPPHKVVGITGTNGKSTTTALVHHILQTAGVPSLMGGNIGLPILSAEPLPEDGVYVLELSSYQLDLTQSLDCDVAVLTNVTPDHLDRYDDFVAYERSKSRLFEMQSEAGLIVWDHMQDGVSSLSDVFDLGFKDLRAEYFGQSPMDQVISERLGPSMQGPHNLSNAKLALQSVWALGLDGDELYDMLRTFTGLPHRMERVREKDGVSFVNDSKATNATASAPALAAFPAIRWILGGQAKSDNLDECAPYFSHVRSAYTIGEASGLFARLLGPHMPVAECSTLDAAVRAAAHDAKAGDTVLLSPACASFDQFRDFEARGDAFREYVRAL